MLDRRWQELGAAMRLGRLARRWSQEQAADLLGVSRDTVRQIETGAGESVRIGTVNAYAALVGVPVVLPLVGAGS